MKKLTIFRNGTADSLSDSLLPSSVYQVFAQSKELAKTVGTAHVIMTSHVQRAVQTAQVIKLANPQARFTETAFLSHYYAGNPRRFISTFSRGLPYYVEHVIVVSHQMNIWDFTNGDCLKRGCSLTIEAESWEDMFNPQKRRYRFNNLNLEGKSSEELASTFSRQDREQIQTLPFMAE